MPGLGRLDFQPNQDLGPSQPRRRVSSAILTRGTGLGASAPKPPIKAKPKDRPVAVGTYATNTPFRTSPVIPGGWVMLSPLPAVLSNRGIRSSFKASGLSQFGFMPGHHYIRYRNQSYI